MGLGLGWKSLKALILRAPLCGANNDLAIVTSLFVSRHLWTKKTQGKSATQAFRGSLCY